ncbi:hypothetical protein UA08_08434 [Talaromyces atroroseus]|uniref:EF-hand domain-containing protein n=1 Tax=Talaromyces atroroseus TaxID=1441469 RepID=A0A1Q5Q7V7_TALAT|nr:hypothetical protein UA08_08434 [Talaromyces atroroseus]OKL56310.1 hypothetical protein UA08_08434 [Talaromyces atroroseus]
MRGSVVALLTLATVAYGHGNHDANAEVSADWATRHMQEEHHIDSFDAGSFFALHDYDNSGDWTSDEIIKTYGLLDSSNAHLSEDQKAKVVREVLDLFSAPDSEAVSRDDWMSKVQAGVRLPDFGHGPGHHGDIEYEYEIHHFEQFHGEDATAEELTHPEDIEHFRLHDEMELAEERLQQLESMQIVESNIPRKFLRNV